MPRARESKRESRGSVQLKVDVFRCCMRTITRAGTGGAVRARPDLRMISMSGPTWTTSKVPGKVPWEGWASWEGAKRERVRSPPPFTQGLGSQDRGTGTKVL
ncbi:hypothetical protein FKM82_018627 [Ascaphus truei]